MILGDARKFGLCILTSMAPLAKFLLACIPYRVPLYLSTYVIGKTPLSTTSAVISVLAGYLAVVFGTKVLMTNRQPYKLTTLFQLHNILLSSGSALLLALILEEIVARIWRHGIRHAICDQEAWTSVSIYVVSQQLVTYSSSEDGILLYY